MSWVFYFLFIYLFILGLAEDSSSIFRCLKCKNFVECVMTFELAFYGLDSWAMIPVHVSSYYTE